MPEPAGNDPSRPSQGSPSARQAGSVAVRKRGLLRACLLALVLAGFAFALLLSVALFSSGPRAAALRSNLVLAVISATTGLDARARGVSVAAGPALIIAGLELRPGTSAPALLTIDRVSISFPPHTLLRGRVGRVEIAGFLYQPPAAAAAESAPRPSAGGGGSWPPRFPCEELAVSAGRIDLGASSSTEPGPEVLIVDDLSVLRVGAAATVFGRVRLEDDLAIATVRGTAGSAGGRVELVAEASTTDLGRVLAPALSETGLPESVTAKALINVSGSFEDILEVRLEARAMQSEAPPAASEPVLLDGRAAIRPAAASAEWQGTIAPGKGLPPIRVSGKVGEWEGTAHIAEIVAEWSGLSLIGAAQLARNWSLPAAALPLEELQGGQAEVTLRIGGLGRDDAAANLNVDLSGLEVERAGGASLAIERMAARLQLGLARRGADGGQPVELTLDAAGVTAHDADYLRLIDNLELRGQSKGTYRGDGGGDAVLTLEARGGELLWGRVYANFARLPLTFGLDARLLDGALEARQAMLSSPEIGSISGTLRYDGEGGLERYDLGFELPGLAAAYDLLVSEPLGQAHPTLAHSRVEGRLSGSLQHRAQAGKLGSYYGRVRLEAGEIELADARTHLRDLTLDMPVNISDIGETGGSETGMLRVEASEIRGIAVPALQAPLRVRPNRVEVSQTVELRMFDGTLRLGGIRADRLATSERELAGWVDLEGFDLAGVSRALALPPLEGELGGRLSKVALTGESVLTEGELGGTVFGGEFEISDVALSRLFTRIPALRLSIDLHEVDLKKATTGLGVGRVSGLIDGYVHDLEVVAGEPVRFEAMVETLPKGGVKQRVSVKAIEQLSILGGAGSDPISRGILSAFEDYRYAKLGFRCSLHNDRFTLKGIEQLDGKDFLVVGTLLPPTVNVISHNQVIAFKEMVARLGRIASSGSGT